MCVKQNPGIPPCGIVDSTLGVKNRSGSSKGVEVERAARGLIMPGEGKIEEIRIELSIEVNGTGRRGMAVHGLKLETGK